MKITLNQRVFSLLFVLTLFFQPIVGQELKPLTLEDYAQWNRITNTSISPDGLWMTYAYAPNEGDSRLHVRRIDGDTIRTSINGKRVSFSENSKWVAYLVDPAKAEADKLKASKKRVQSSLHLLSLNDNNIQEFKGTRSFSFSEATNYIGIHKNAVDPKAEHKGSDLLLKDLQGNRTLNIGNVSSYAFNKTGSLFAYTVDADEDSGNGLYVINLTDLRSWPLHTGAYTYAQMSWNKGGDKIAVLFGDKKDGNVERDNNIYWAEGLAAGMTNPASQNEYAIQKENYVISEYSPLRWNEANTQLFLGIKAQSEEVKKSDMLKANVDVWHWKDEVVQSRQMITANRDKRATHTAVLNLGNKRLIQIGTEDMSFARTNQHSNWAVASVDTAYRAVRNMPAGYADLYAVNTSTGDQSLIAERVYNNMGISPKGDYALYARNGATMLYNFETKATTNLSTRSDLNFQNLEFDRPVEKPTYGIAGWSADGKWVMLNHKYDIYAFSLNSNEVINLTQGIGQDQEIRFRLVQLDPDADRFDVSENLLLSAYGEKTKKSGYYQVKVGKKPKALRFEDKMIGRLNKAKSADRVIYTEQTFVDFPDYWVSDLTMKRPKKVTDANPQQSGYKWGKRVLVDYTDKRGHKLQATLALPADYEEGKKYPMVIYFYEKMSQRHHQYSMPTYDDRPHMSTYASNGYLVLMPDIIYTEGKPGTSALDDVTSAAQAVIDLGYADPDRIGLQGHSWGGYESSFIVTQTDMFACVVTGAPLTNLISMYNVAYKRSGNLNGPILEWSQGRMAVSPWDDMELYRSQSPIHHAQNINTPFMILHGTADGAVDWVQGLEYYSTARRLGKEVILLSYPDEPHHLSKEENQKDFQIRMKQYFDHYLKDAEAPLWMKEGVKHLDKKKIKPEMMGKEK
ncbi:prolyl oligopeptidase family serine peptidase [Roseivirga sp. 4D4]|uniref:S9 family peptidase n=1 Tax=Roseivirga sp. 4D4 TaxID=1889784 RepID=UPI0009F5A6DD|nr:prolyl oligopeptidase family serine peptidase [Roseivirga sp. 4D4]